MGGVYVYSLFCLVLCFLCLWPFLARGICAASFPLPFTFNDVQSSKEEHHTYGALKDLKTYHYGEYWEVDYNFSNKLSNAERFVAMEKVILKQLDNPSYSFSKYGFLECDEGEEEYVMNLAAYGKKATLKLLKS